MKKRKKYNPRKYHSVYMEGNFRALELGILYLGNDKCCSVVCLKTFNKLDITLKTCQYLFNTPLAWSVINGVFLIESKGKLKSIYEEIHPINNQRCLQAQLTHALNQEHRRLVQELRDKGLSDNICNIGWLATPYTLDLDEHLTHIDSVFSHYGAFDL